MDRTLLLEEAARQHQNLRQAAEQLRALRETPVDDESYEQMRGQVSAQAEQFKETLAAHFRFEEEGGYFSHIGASRPGLVPRVKKLELQHVQLLASAQKLAVALQRGADLESAFSRIDELLTRLGRHEAQELDLLQQSIIEDVGRSG